MKPLTCLLAATVLVAGAVTQAGAATTACAKTCERREVRMLSDDERNRYFAAVSQLMSNGKYDAYTKHHLDYQSWAHSTGAFFTWHRAMIRELEKELQAVDPSVCLHYWSWDIDSQAPEKSPVFAQGWYGSHDPSTGCVTFPWRSDWQPAYPQPGCLTRKYDDGNQISAFSSPEIVNQVIVGATTYDALRRRTEGNPHALPHDSIGGHFSTMASPSDPLFYAHHAFIDKIYWQWQRAKPSLAHTYGGPNGHGAEVAEDDELTPFPYQVRDVFDIDQLCYTYVDLPSDQTSGQALPSPSASGGGDGGDGGGDPDAQVAQVASVGAAPPTPSPQAVMLQPVRGNDTQIDAHDRTSLNALRVPFPVSERWLQMNNMPVAEARQYEAQAKAVYDQLNALSGYISPCALYHRHDLWAALVGVVDKFTLDVPGTGQVALSYSDKNAYQVVSDCKAAIQKYAPNVYVPPEQLHDRLVPIVGESTAASADSASNFMATPQPAQKVGAASSAGAGFGVSSLVPAIVAMAAALALA